MLQVLFTRLDQGITDYLRFTFPEAAGMRRLSTALLWLTGTVKL